MTPRPQAVAAVRAMQARGIQSIDVGCGQINLMHHPDAFASLEQAFDPQANAVYAARFLKELFAQTGDWNKAAGDVPLGNTGAGRRVSSKRCWRCGPRSSASPASSARHRWPRPGAPR